MNNPRFRANKYTIYSIIIVLFIIYLAFKGLDNNFFWDDESDTAVVARNFLKYKSLTAWDGSNLAAAYDNGYWLYDNFASPMPPVQYYIVATSFAIFKATTFYARLPFVIIGLFSLLFLHLTLKEELGNRKINLYALIVFGLSASFLLFIRQAHSYALLMLLPLAIYYFYKKYLKTGKKYFLIFLVAAAFVLFYSHYFVCIAFIGALAADHLVFHFKKKTLIPLIVSFLSFAALAAPLFIIKRILDFSRISGIFYTEGGWLHNKLILMYWNLREINAIGWLPVIIFAALLAILLISMKNKQFLSDNLSYIMLIKEWLLIVVAFALFIPFVTLQAAANTSIADIRYLPTVLPFTSGLTAVFLFFIEKKSKILAFILLLMVVFTNFLSLPLIPSGDMLNRQIRFDLIWYINEVHHDYTTSYEAIVEFLGQNAGQADVVFISPDYMNYPVMFYAGDKVKLCCLLDNATSLPIDKLHKLGGEHLFTEEAKPKWIILSGQHTDTPSILRHFSRDGSRYMPFKYINIFWRDMTRPEILWHSYGPVADFNQTYQGIYVYKREESI